MAGHLPRRRGQASVEFVMMATVLMIVMVVGVQFAVIGKVSLALAQMTYQGARYAVANEGCDGNGCSGISAGNQSVRAYMLAVGSSVFNNNSSLLTVTVTPAAPRTFGRATTVSSTFTLPGTVLFLPNPFVGLVHFPTQVSTSQVEMSN